MNLWLVLEPWMETWQSVQAWNCVSWLWKAGVWSEAEAPMPL